MCVCVFVCEWVCRYLAEQRQLDVHAGPESCAQVGGASQDVAQPLVPHELPALLLDQALHLHTHTCTKGHTHGDTRTYTNTGVDKIN